MAPPSGPAPPPSAWRAFIRTVTLFQWEKVDPWMALRNTIGIALPLAIGVATESVNAGLVMSTGALNVAFTDSHLPYIQRAQRMLMASVLVGFAVMLGTLSGSQHGLILALTIGWAFAAGLLVALSTTAADLGVISLITLLVLSATPMPPERAISAGLLAFCGGVLQALLAVALWPIRRHAPERNALGELFAELSRFAKSHPEATQSPPGTTQVTAARDAIAALSGTHTVETERSRVLLSEAERIRLTILTLTRLRVRLRREMPEATAAEVVEKYLEQASETLGAIALRLLSTESVPADTVAFTALEEASTKLRTLPDGPSSIAAATLTDARHQMDALNGQLRAAFDLAASSTPSGQLIFVRTEATRPPQLRLEGTLAILRANLTLRSTAFRHAIRLAVCVGLGELLGWGLHFHRSYWLPMTVAIILKPDFGATFSRGVMRLMGTFAGLLLATAAFHWLPSTVAMQAVMVAVLTFAFRWLGPANYSILVTAVTAMVVALVAMSGTAPADVTTARALNSIAGGAIALIAYAVWPTWERLQAPEALARMLDSYRDYFRAIRESFEDPEHPRSQELDAVRSKARLARTNLEASVERLAAEPRRNDEDIHAFNAILATSHRFVHAMMALEAGLSASGAVPARELFPVFANQLELTLYYLASALRGSAVVKEDLPDLREAHQALVHSSYSPADRYALVNVETDRMTNALNTLSGQVLDRIARGNGLRTSVEKATLS